MSGTDTAAHALRESTDDEATVRFVLRHADDNLVLAQRLSWWISRAHDLEEDIALANIGLDHLGTARALYRYAAAIEGGRRTEDDMAFLRDERQFTNLLLVERPNGDFAMTIVRQMFVDLYQELCWESLAKSGDTTIAGIAAKAAKENAYHVRHSTGWVVRLGDGTAESHDRTQRAVDVLWRFTGEPFATDQLDDRMATIGIGWRPDTAEATWLERVRSVLADATIALPDTPRNATGGRRGIHSEDLGHLLAEMQWMQRTHPGASW